MLPGHEEAGGMLRTCGIGDVVAWADVPDGALVFDRGSDMWPEPAYAIRRGDRGRWVHEERVTDWTLTLAEWPWQTGEDSGQGANGVSIVALDVPADATAEHLCELAGRFAVREDIASALRRADRGSRDPRDEFFAGLIVRVAAARADEDEDEAATELAAQLHRAGWRPGMAAEEAARLLAEDR